MALPTVFDGIDKNDFTGQVSALKQEIDKRLGTLIDDLRHTRAMAVAVTEWYEKNTASTLAESRDSETRIKRSSLEEKITVNSEEIDLTIGKEYLNLFSLLNERELTVTLTSRFMRRAPGEKQAFIASLKEQGETLLQDLQRDIDEANVFLDQTKQDAWISFRAAFDHYDELLLAIATKDPQALLHAFKSEAAASVSADLRRELLLTPVDKHKTIFEAIGSLEVPQEAEIASNLASSFSDNLDGLVFLTDIADAVSEAPAGKRYTAYAAAFAGTMVPNGEGNFFNASNVMDALYNADNRELKIWYINSTRDELELDEHKASAIMRVLEAKPGFMTYNDNLFNKNTITDVSYDDEKRELKAFFSNKTTLSWNVSKGKANEFYDTLCSDGSFIKIGSGVHNVASLCDVLYFEDKNHFDLFYSNGTKTRYTMNAEQAQYAHAQLLALPVFEGIGGDVHNANSITEAEYKASKEQLILYYRYAGKTEYSMPEHDAQDIISTLAKRENFIRIGKHSVENFRTVIEAEYKEEDNELTVFFANKQNSKFDIDREDALSFLDQISALKGFVRTGKHIAHNISNIVDTKVIDDGDTLKIWFANHQNSVIELTPGEIANFNQTLLKNTNFMEIEGCLHNFNTMTHAIRTSDGIKISYVQGENTYTLENDEAERILKNIRRTGQKLAVAMAGSGNRTELQYALKQAQSWETQQRNNGTYDHDSAMDYLPFIIMMEMMTASGDETIMTTTQNVPDSITPEAESSDTPALSNDFTGAATGNDYSITGFESLADLASTPETGLGSSSDTTLSTYDSNYGSDNNISVTSADNSSNTWTTDISP